MRENIKVVFMGTPEFARESLKELVESGYDVVACFTNPDKPSGRGMQLKASAVKEYALEHNIQVYQPKKVRNNVEILNTLKEIAPDFIAVVAYGKILPEEILKIPKYGCINVHGSLLPKYRGSAPMQWALMNGDTKTGITTMYMDKGMDTGDMILKEEIELKEEHNLEYVHDTLMVIGAKLLVKTLDMILDGNAPREKQPDDYTVAPMITKEMTKVDFNKSCNEIFNKYRGLTPFPGVYMETQNGVKYKIKEMSYEKKNIEGYESGDIIDATDEGIDIKCNDGYIRIKVLQPENRKAMDVASFLRGYKLNKQGRFI